MIGALEGGFGSGIGITIPYHTIPYHGIPCHTIPWYWDNGANPIGGITLTGDNPRAHRSTMTQKKLGYSTIWQLSAFLQGLEMGGAPSTHGAREDALSIICRPSLVSEAADVVDCVCCINIRQGSNNA